MPDRLVNIPSSVRPDTTSPPFELPPDHEEIYVQAVRTRLLAGISTPTPEQYGAAVHRTFEEFQRYRELGPEAQRVVFRSSVPLAGLPTHSNDEPAIIRPSRHAVQTNSDPIPFTAPPRTRRTSSQNEETGEEMQRENTTLFKLLQEHKKIHPKSTLVQQYKDGTTNYQVRDMGDVWEITHKSVKIRAKKGAVYMDKNTYEVTEFL